MAKHFYTYTDAIGRKQGPIDEQQLKTFAVQGIIKPTTPVETDTGYKGVAGQIPGLFPSAPDQSTVPPVPPTAPSTSSGQERIGAAVTKGTEWAKETYEKAKPHVLAAAEKVLSKDASPVSSVTASSFDSLFDIHFTRFLTVPVISAVWVMLIVSHFLGGIILLGRMAYVDQQEYTATRKYNTEVRKSYVEAKRKYGEDKKKYDEDKKKYDKDMKEYPEARKKYNEDMAAYNRMSRDWRQSGEKGVAPRRPQEPQEPQKPQEPRIPDEPPYRTADYRFTWHFLVLPFAIISSLLIHRLFLEIIIVLFRNEANTRVTKEYYKRMEKAQKYDIE